MRRWMLGAVLLMGGAAAAANDYLECQDVDAIRRGPEALAAYIGAEIDQCRRTSVHGVDTLNCELARPRTAFGLSVVELSASLQAGGTRRLALMFKAGEERLRPAVEKRIGIGFEPDVGGWLAFAPDDVTRRFRVVVRDDGATQLACEITGEPVASLNAVVEGRLAYPGAAKAPTRVCAIPVDTSLPLRCTELPAKLKKFRIDGLAGADYYLAAYALEGNPEGVVAAYGRKLRDCSDAPAGCVAALLVPFKVSTGVTHVDVRIDQRFAAVPERVGRVREGR